MMTKYFNFKIIDMKVYETNIRLKRGTEEEPFAGVLNPWDIYMEIVTELKADLAAGKNLSYVFDGPLFKTEDEMIDAFTNPDLLGLPDSIIVATC